ANRFFHGEVPVDLTRLDDHVKDVRILLNVPHTGAGLIHELLQRSAADGAVRGQPKCELTLGVRARLRARLPAHAKRSGVARERFCLRAAMARPRSERTPYP